MNIEKTAIDELFWVDDLIACANGETFRITAIHDDRVQLLALKEGGGQFSVTYGALAASIQCSDASETPHDDALLGCVRDAYHRRVEQAKRDAEVDAMWRSAIVCQLQ
jgi:hypothetical protein